MTTALAIQVIADFRGRKQSGYWKIIDGEECFAEELKIIPLETGAIKTFLQLGLKYEQLYSIFEKAHKAELKSPKGWYESNIVKETARHSTYAVGQTGGTASAGSQATGANEV